MIDSRLAFFQRNPEAGQSLAKRIHRLAVYMRSRINRNPGDGIDRHNAAGRPRGGIAVCLGNRTAGSAGGGRHNGGSDAAGYQRRCQDHA